MVCVYLAGVSERCIFHRVAAVLHHTACVRDTRVGRCSQARFVMCSSVLVSFLCMFTSLLCICVSFLSVQNIVICIITMHMVLQSFVFTWILC